MKVEINLMACEAHGVCVRWCPEVFELDNDNLTILLQNIPDDLHAKVKTAVGACPRQALSIEE